MTSHSGIQKVTLTGSVATGKKVAESTASHLGRVTLELGGNDAAIVLPDVDPNQIAAEIFNSAFSQNGQACVAIKRLYVHQNVFDEMVEELRKHAEKVVLGDGLNPDVNMGPIKNLAQLERVIELIEDAKEHGCKIVTGGQATGSSRVFFSRQLL